jgi:RHS repeat-associated protein
VQKAEHRPDEREQREGTHNADKEGFPPAGTCYYHPDQVGNVRYITNSEGIKVYETAYAPYGEKVASKTTATINPAHYMYTGQEDDGTGLYYYGARYYDPEIARFAGADTIIDGADQVAGYNRFMYVHGNPIIWNDPTGHYSWSEFKSDVSSAWSSVKSAFSGGSVPGHNANIDRGRGDNKQQGGSTQTISNNTSPTRQVSDGMTVDDIIDKQRGEENPTGEKKPADRPNNPSSSSGGSVIAKAKKAAAYIWNSPIARYYVPDIVSIGGGVTAIGGLGNSTSVEMNFILRGPEASIKPMITTSLRIGVGFNVSATLNLSRTNVIGPVSSIRRSFVITNSFKSNDNGSLDMPTYWCNLGINEFIHYSSGMALTISDSATMLTREVGYGVSIPLEFPYPDFSTGVGNTFLLKDFY